MRSSASSTTPSASDPAPRGPWVVQVERLTAGYGDETILEDVSFRVARSEVLAILGGSGCGKSTLLKHMIGLLPPLEGRVLVGGEDLVTAQGADRARLLRRIGVMYQGGALFGSLDLLENVCLPLEEFTDLPRPARELVGRMKLSLVGLQDFAEHLPAEISGGMQKRAAIARAMALDPPILFLDEPSAGLDPITSAELDELILELSRSLGMTFVVVTHEIASVLAIADRVLVLDRDVRGILDEGPPRVLQRESRHPLVRRFFHRGADPDSAASRTEQRADVA